MKIVVAKHIKRCRNDGRWVVFDEEMMPIGRYSSKKLAEEALLEYIKNNEQCK